MHHSAGGDPTGFVCGQNSRDAGYHYVVTREGRINRVAPEGDTVWHSGNWWMNLRSIGICGANTGNQDWPAAQQNALTWLVADVCRRYGIPVDRVAVIRHREVTGGTACPGTMPVDEIVRRAAAGTPAPTPAPPPPPPMLNAGGDNVIQLLSTPQGRADLLTLGTDGNIWWQAGQGTAAAMRSNGTRVGGSGRGGTRAFTATYWSDYSHIDLVLVTADDGWQQMAQLRISDGRVTWADPRQAAAMIPVMRIPGQEGTV